MSVIVVFNQVLTSLALSADGFISSTLDFWAWHDSCSSNVSLLFQDSVVKRKNFPSGSLYPECIFAT